jgi:hypothetical protein
MRKLSGAIKCAGRTKIKNDSIVRIQAMECFFDRAPNILGSITITHANSFPILFEILIDETPILENYYNGIYLIFVTIERKEKLIYANDGMSFVHEHLKLILDQVDVELDEM